MKMAGDRFSSERYVNWLKDSLALLYAKEGLEHFSEEQVQCFHDEIKNQLGVSTSATNTTGPSEAFTNSIVDTSTSASTSVADTSTQAANTEACTLTSAADTSDESLVAVISTLSSDSVVDTSTSSTASVVGSSTLRANSILGTSTSTETSVVDITTSSATSVAGTSISLTASDVGTSTSATNSVVSSSNSATNSVVGTSTSSSTSVAGTSTSATSSVGSTPITRTSGIDAAKAASKSGDVPQASASVVRTTLSSPSVIADASNSTLSPVIRTPNAASIPVIGTTASDTVGICTKCDQHGPHLQWRAGKFRCPNNVCHRWISALQNWHRHSQSKVLRWNRDVVISNLPVDPWECANLYLPYNGSRAANASELDMAGLLSLFINCTWFHRSLGNIQILEEIRQIRNRILHSGTMEIESSELNRDISKILELLSLPIFSQDSHCQEAKAKIIQLRDNLLDISLNKEWELSALNHKLAAVRSDVDRLEAELQHQHFSLSDVTTRQDRQDTTAEEYRQMCERVIQLGQNIREIKTDQEQITQIIDPSVSSKMTDLTSRLQELETNSNKEIERLEGSFQSTIAGIETRLGSLETQRVTPQTDQPVDIKGLQRQLIRLYEVQRQHIPVYLLRSERKIRLEDMYVEQCLKVVDPDGRMKTDSTISHSRHQARSEDLFWTDSHDISKSDKNEKFISSLRDVFYREGNKCQFVYVSGNAGYGKSVFCSHLVRLWCKAHSDIITALTQDEALMAEFPLLFCVDLRDAKYDGTDQTSDELCSLIQKQLQLSKLGLNDDVLSKLLQTDGQVLVVMDALDQCKEERLPRGGLYNGYTTLVTSRPWKLEALRCDPECRVDKELEIVGLKKGSLEDLSENLMKLLNRKWNKCKNSKDFLMQMYEQGLEELLNVPNFLLSVLPAWFDDVPVGMSLTEIYKNIFHHQLLAAVNMKDIPYHSCYTEVPFPICQREKCPCKCFEELLWKVSEVACRALLGNVRKRSLIMDHDQTEFLGLTDKEVTICMKLGILTQYKLLGSVIDYEPQKSVSFTHKTFQEWFAALYISSKLPMPELEKMLSEAIIDLDSALELDQLFLFVCGLNAELAAKLSEFIMSKVSSDTRIQKYRRSNDDRHDQLIRTIQDVVVAGREEALKNNKETGALQLHDVYIEGDSKKFSTEKILACDTSHAKSVYLRNIHKEEGDFKESKITPWPPSSCLEKLHLQNITNALDDTFCDNFSAAHLVHLHFRNVTLTHNQLESLCESLATTGSLRTVDIEGITCITHKENKQDCSCMLDLSQNQGLEDVTLQDLGVAEVKGISLSQNMDKLEMIKLRNVTLTHDQLESLCESLALAGSLKTVDIDGITCITHKDNKQDCSFKLDLSQHQGLEHVTLQDLGVAEVKGVNLSQNMDKLEKVELRGFFISSAAVRQILKNLPEHQMEVKLGVHDSPLRLRGEEEVSQLLKEILHQALSYKKHGWIFELRMESNQEEIAVFPLEREPQHIKDAGSGQEDHEHEPVTEQEPGAEPVQKPESEREMKAEPEREPKKDLESEPGKEAKQKPEMEVEQEAEQEPQLEQEMETEPAQVNEAERKRVPNPAAEHGKEPENTTVREKDDKPEDEPKAETKVKEEEAGDKSAENKVEQVPIQEQIYQTVNCCVDNKLAPVTSKLQELTTRMDKWETSKEDGANSVTSSKAVQANEQHTRSNRQKCGCWKCGSHDHLYKNCPAKKGKGKRDAPVKKKLHRRVKAATDVDYPAYGVTGPTKERLPSPGDRKLAQSAQMYHYQHQKQQMIAMEKANGEMKQDGSEDESEEENEEGDYTVYECPGLAPTGEMEVRNPLFTEEAQTPVNGTGPGGATAAGGGAGQPDQAEEAQE